MESQLSRLLLQAIHTYESRQGYGPTVRELAEDLGIPPEFGYTHLVERLQRQLSLKRVSCKGGHFVLTATGLAVVEGKRRKEMGPVAAGPIDLR